MAQTKIVRRLLSCTSVDELFRSNFGRPENSSAITSTQPAVIVNVVKTRITIKKSHRGIITSWHSTMKTQMINTHNILLRNLEKFLSFSVKFGWALIYKLTCPLWADKSLILDLVLWIATSTDSNTRPSSVCWSWFEYFGLSARQLPRSPTMNYKTYLSRFYHSSRLGLSLWWLLWAERD